jgi:DNA-binding NarL/FixJ family response regulator
MPTHVLVVECHAAVRLAVLRRLDGGRRLLAVGVGTATEALELANEQRFDVVVAGHPLGYGEDALRLTRALRRLPDPPAVLLYATCGTQFAALAMVAGAQGLLSRGALHDELCEAACDVAAGRPRRPVLSNPIVLSLSLRLQVEHRIPFHLWTAGASDAEIAMAQNLSDAELERVRSAVIKELSQPETAVPWDDGSWPLAHARARRLRQGRMG